MPSRASRPASLSPVALPFSPAASQERRVREAVQSALCHPKTNSPGHERRRNERHLYPFPIEMVPVDETLRPVGTAFVAMGNHLSVGGLDFYHREPLTCRRVIATLEAEGGRQVSLLLNLTWCRFSRQGWYINGGRFTQVLDAAESGVTALSA